MQQQQGWDEDPFGRFEQRYFSHGAPTTLVRTAGVEARDVPEAVSAELVEVAPVEIQPDVEAASVLRPQLYQVRRHRILGPLVFVLLVGGAFIALIALSALPLATLKLLGIVTVALAILVLTASRQRAA